jgi:hypothetical protein
MSPSRFDLFGSPRRGTSKGWLATGPTESRPEMEGYFRRSRSRLGEHERRTNPDGSVALTKRRRMNALRFTKKPPQESRIRRWREELEPQEVQRFESVAGGLLVELGYPLAAGTGTN